MNLLIQLFHMFWAPSAEAGTPHLKRHLGLERRWLVGGNQRAAKHWLDFKLRYDSSARARAQLYRLTFHKSIIRKSFWSWADELTAATFQRVHQVAQSCRAPHTSLLTWSYRVSHHHDREGVLVLLGFMSQPRCFKLNKAEFHSLMFQWKESYFKHDFLLSNRFFRGRTFRSGKDIKKQNMSYLIFILKLKN